MSNFSAIQIDKILSQTQVDEIINFFYSSFENNGFNFLNKYSQINDPLSKVSSLSIKHDIIRILSNFFGDFYFYESIKKIANLDHNCDFILKQYKIFMPHTDKVTSIPGYTHFKDVIFPLATDKNKLPKLYICSQTYTGKAIHLRLGDKKDAAYKPKYATVISQNPYEQYGIKGISYSNQVPESWLNKFIGRDLPKSYFSGLSIKKIFDWKPGSMIALDPEIIHGPTNYRLIGANWKMGMTIRLFKKN